MTLPRNPKSHHRSETPVCVLSIAGSDNCAGAGVQADLKTCEASGTYCTTVITAITAQNCYGVQEIEYVGDSLLEKQLTSTLDTITADAVKIGLIPEEAATDIVGEIITRYQLRNIVADPVLGPTSGGRWNTHTEAIIKAMSRHIWPHCTVITPNLPEFRTICRVLGIDIRTGSTAHDDAASALIEKTGVGSILLKGGHAVGEDCIDLLFTPTEKYSFSARRIPAINTHGTGCVLSSAITCGLAHGLTISEAAAEAKRYVARCLEISQKAKLTPVNGPLLHFPHIFAQDTV